MTTPLTWFSIPALQGCRFKTERADEHIKNITGEFNTLIRTLILERQHNIISFDINPETGEHGLNLRGDYPIATVRYGILVGEVIYQLRSALDHLVWQLVVANGNTPTKYTSFPIVLSDPASLVAKPGVLKTYKRKIKGISASAQALIERLQPYKRGGRDNPLAVINEMNNRDKHQAILIIAAMTIVNNASFVAKTGEALSTPADLPCSPEFGAELERFLRGNPWEGMNVNIQVALNVTFPQIGLRKDQPVIPTLKDLRDATVNIINEFRSEFP